MQYVFKSAGMNRFIGLFMMMLSFILQSCAQQSAKNVELKQGEEYSIEWLVKELINPWGMVQLPDFSFLITEKSGKLIHFKNGVKTSIGKLPEIYVNGQGGLLDIVIDPNYTKNKWVYISYSAPNQNMNGGNTAILRARIKNDEFVDKQLLYKATPDTDSGTHFGSRMVFDDKGYLYFTIGDRYEREVNPQSIERDGGKVYRINSNGTIPTDSPFYSNDKAKKAIFTYGHRNPQGMIFHPTRKEVWIHEHGPKGGDEINIINSGKNYGWPLATFGINYWGTKITKNTSLPNMENPVLHWTPSIAPCGMALVTSNKYPELKNSILVGSLKFSYLEQVVFNGKLVTARFKLLPKIGRLRNVIQGRDGYIYVSIENKGIAKVLPNK